MKILHTNFLHGWGGQSNRILNVCQGLAERGHDVLIAAPADSELVRRAQALGLATDGSIAFERGFRPFSLVRDIRRMRKLLARKRFDVIHTHGSQDSWVVAFANLPKRLPVVRTKHNIFPISDNFANRWLYRRAFDRIVCISEAIVEQCSAKPYIGRDRLALIHSAVDLQRFAQPDMDAAQAMREQWKAHQPIVAIVGRLREEKGHRFLFEAVARLRHRFPALLLIVAGDGSLRQELEQLAATLDIADQVQFLGFRTDVPEILAAADLFVMPSLSEGLGTAAIEASAAGCPIIASRVGGITDVICDGETGRLAEPGDIAGLARAITDFVSDPALAKRMAQAARRCALEHFTVEALVEKNLALYSKVLEKRP
jgi:glycosyltransferase involved in cell wall biosynthesis